MKYRGLWRRRLLIDADGTRDAATIVFWLQTDQYFADIRIPSDRPDFGNARSFAALDATQLCALARQEGFAGTLEWTDAACAWRRQIDFRPTGGPPDEGWMESRSDELIIETGLHVPYLEEWVRDAGPVASDGPGFGAVLSGGAIAVRSGAFVMVAQDRRPAPPPADLEKAVLEAAGDEDALSRLLDCEISLGVADAVTGDIIIRHSTLPWREGEVLVLPE